MRKKVLLSFCLLAGFTFGQSFTSSNDISTGTTQTLYLCDSATTNLASIVGDGVVWDYSKIKRFTTTNPIARTFKYQSNQKPTVFTNAQQTKTSDEPLSFYLSSNSNERFIEGFEFEDANFGLVTVNLTTNNMKLMTYPFGLNNEVKDAFSGKLIAGTLVNSACSGNSVSKIDGRGKIMLGNGVEINNVIRHHLEFSLDAITLLGAVKVNVKQYEYYDLTNSNLPVFTHTYLDVTQNSASLVKMNFVFNSVEPMEVSGLIENEINKLTVSPNPVEDVLTISDNTVKSIQITDLSGKVLKTSSTTTLNVSELNAGVYLVVIEKDGEFYSEKFIKQ